MLIIILIISYKFIKKLFLITSGMYLKKINPNNTPKCKYKSLKNTPPTIQIYEHILVK